MFSLQSLCLDLIVENFQRFYVTFTESKDVNLQRNLEFLQKRFSDHLSQKLLKDGKNIDAYFDFLINKHLKTLHLEWFIHSRRLKCTDDIFCRVPNLTKVTTSHGDSVLKSVAKFCPNIIEIDARISDITDKGLKYLCEMKDGNVPCPKIKNIFISHSSVTDKGIEYLVRYLPLIERIDHRNLPLILYYIHNDELSKSSNVRCYNLIELDLKGCDHLPFFTDILKTCLAVCPKLESVTCNLREEHLDIFHCSHLKKFDLFCKSIDLNVENLLKINGRTLTRLVLSNCTISISALATHCPVLEELTIYNVDFADNNNNNNFQAIFPRLVRYCLFGVVLPGVEAFTLLFLSSPNLEFVLFSACLLTPEWMSEFLNRCRSSSVKDIKFQFLYLELNFIREILVNLPSLKQMSLHDCNYDDSNTEEILKELAKKLPNKPIIDCNHIFSA